MKKPALTAVILALAGCASDRLSSYVGRDLSEVVIENGQPSAVIDLPEGYKAFQWVTVYTSQQPATVTTTGNAPSLLYGGSFSSTTEIEHGTQKNSYCAYTLVGKELDDRWVITGYRQPSLNCKLWGLPLL